MPVVNSEFLKKISDTVDFYKETYDKYHKLMRFAYKSVLTQQDIKKLKAQNIDTFEMQSVRPFLDPQIKQLSDAAPNLSFTSEKNEMLAQQMQDYFETIKERSKYDSQVYKTFKNTAVGGLSVLKLKTAYINDTSFDQEITIESVENPTCVFFDAGAREASKSDADFVFELKKYKKDAFIAEFGADAYKSAVGAVKLLKDGGVKWLEYEKSPKEQLTVCEYYYYKDRSKYLVLLPDLAVQTGQATETFDKKKDIPPQALKTRKVKDRTVMRQTFCATTVLEKPSDSNFDLLPYSFVCGDTYIDAEGRPSPSSFIEKSIDPMRMKTIALNLFFYNLKNRISSSVIADPDVVPKTVCDDIRVNGINRSLYEISSTKRDSLTGQLIPVEGIKILSREAISQEELTLVNTADDQIAKILGGVSNENNGSFKASGAYLTRLTDFISASADPFLQTFMDALEHIGKVILTTASKLTNRTIDSSLCTVSVNRSVNTKLLKMESLEQLSKFAREGTALGAFLASPKGAEYIIDNLDIDSKDQLKADFEQMGKPNPQMQQMQMQQAQQQMQMQESETQAKMLTAQANMINAEAKVQQAHVQAGKTQSDAIVQMKKIAADETNAINEGLLKHKALEAENYKTHTELFKSLLGR